jgi:hypothetical protein
MPLPFILLGIAALAGGYGVKKGVDAYDDNEKADELTKGAQHVYGAAEEDLRRSRRWTTDTLTALGRLKLEVWDDELHRFANLYGKLHPIELINRMDVEAGRVPVTSTDLGKMAELSGFAQQALTGGAAALGAGALAGVAAYGGAVMFAAASTGTAITALAGAAATNATLAWFGGGAIAAGGMGMGLGMAVLGGIVAGPVLAIGGVLWASMAEENLAKARENMAQARRAAAEMQTAVAALDGIRSVATQFLNTITAVRDRFRQVLDGLDWTISHHGTDYRRYGREQRELVHLTVVFAQAMKALLETPFLTRDGAVRDDYGPALTAGMNLLPQGAHA